MKTEHKTQSNWLGTGALLAAIGASACCVGPLLLLSLGIGGAWMSTLTSMAPIRPFFVIATLLFIALGFRKLYLTPQPCTTGDACAINAVQRRQRLFFWGGSMLILLLLAFPWYAPLFMT